MVILVIGPSGVGKSDYGGLATEVLCCSPFSPFGKASNSPRVNSSPNWLFRPARATPTYPTSDRCCRR